MYCRESNTIVYMFRAAAPFGDFYYSRVVFLFVFVIDGAAVTLSKFFLYIFFLFFFFLRSWSKKKKAKLCAIKRSVSWKGPQNKPITFIILSEAMVCNIIATLSRAHKRRYVTKYCHCPSHELSKENNSKEAAACKGVKRRNISGSGVDKSCSSAITSNWCESLLNELLVLLCISKTNVSFGGVPCVIRIFVAAALSTLIVNNTMQIGYSVYAAFIRIRNVYIKQKGDIVRLFIFKIKLFTFLYCLVRCGSIIFIDSSLDRGRSETSLSIFIFIKKNYDKSFSGQKYSITLSYIALRECLCTFLCFNITQTRDEMWYLSL